MISGDELAFVRLAMRRRLLDADQVREAVERQKWDTPHAPIPEILVEMGVLEREVAAELRRAAKGEDPAPHRPRATMVAQDPRVAPRIPVDERDEEEEPLAERTPTQLGPYRLVKLLGAGAMGAVYQARHVELEREVALKLLVSEGAPSPRAVQRFKREARLAARLDHPNVVRVYEAAQDKGYHYIAMDMVRGMSVAELIALGEMSPRRAVYVMRRVCEAVAYAHERDVIHRDLKPANILVEEASGEARVTDFGLAVLAEGGEDDRLTRTGAAVGTPAYMAPEQVRGQLDRIDARTDVYALGATFYEMLTGKPPFEANTFLELAKKICDHPPAAPRRLNVAVPKDVETICLKALEKAPQNRYQTAADMAADLAAFLSEQEIAAKPPGALVRAGRWARRHPVLVGAVGCVLTVLVGGLGFYLTQPGDLAVTTTPAGAVVLVDEMEVGVSPVRVALPAGRHVLRFRKEGYLDRAMGIDEVRINHLGDHAVSGQLVSERGLLRVTSDPPGAQVTVEAQRAPGEPGPVVERGTTPFLASLRAGPYRVRLQADGYVEPAPRDVTVAPGGAEEAIAFSLAPDPAALVVQASPENVTLRRPPADDSYAAPAELRGAGEHEVLADKVGWLPRALRVRVPEQTRRTRRLSLAPLLAYRRALEGRLLGSPLARDVDGDGALDLVALERAEGGTRLVVLPGGGGGGALFRAPTVAERLVDAVDVDADGVLDVVLGDAEHLEVRDGRDGAPLFPPLDVDARAVAVADGRPAQLLIHRGGGDVIQRDLDLTIGLRRPRAQRLGASGAPALIRSGGALAGQGRGLVAAYALEGRIALWSVDERKVSRQLDDLEGITPASPLVALRVAIGADPWLVALPRRGPAWLLDPFGEARHRIGAEDARYTRAAGVLAERGAWLLLGDARGETAAFPLGQGGASAAPARLGPDALVLAEGGEPVVWTRGGEVYALADGAWALDPLRTSEAEVWAATDAEPIAADLDLDGVREVITASADRRSLVALAPHPGRLRWRARLAPGALAPARLRAQGGPDLVAVDGADLLALAREDGRELGRVTLPGPIEALAAGPAPEGARSLLFALCDVAGERQLVIVTAEPAPGGEAVALRAAASAPLQASGLEPLPLDVNGDGATDLLVGGPLGVVSGSDGSPIWRGPSDEERARIGPRFLPAGEDSGAVAVCVGVGRAGEVPAVVGHDQSGARLWATPLDGERPRLLLGATGLPVFAVVTERRVLALRRASGSVVWERPLEGAIGGALHGGAAPRLLVTRPDGDLIAFDPLGGDPLWVRRLPGADEGLPSAPVVLPDAVEGGGALAATVAGSGALVLTALEDGAFLGERRYPDGRYRPELTVLAGGRGEDERVLPPALLLRSLDGRLVALDLPPTPRAALTRRARVRSAERLLERGPAFAALALEQLRKLSAEEPSDPATLLGLARAHMRRGEAEAALEVLRRYPVVRAEGEERVPPEVLRLQVQATYAREESPEAVRPLLEALGRVDPALAAREAVALARRADAAGNAGLAEAFLVQAIAANPRDPEARVALGELMLRQLLPTGARERPQPFSNLVLRWTRLAPKDLLRVRARAEQARTHLVFALTAREDDRARAAALVAAVLERHLDLEVEQRGGGSRRSELVEEVIAALAGGGRMPPLADPVLVAARRLTASRTLTDDELGPLLEDALLPLRRDWEVPLAGIKALGRR